MIVATLAGRRVLVAASDGAHVLVLAFGSEPQWVPAVQVVVDVERRKKKRGMPQAHVLEVAGRRAERDAA